MVEPAKKKIEKIIKRGFRDKNGNILESKKIKLQSLASILLKPYQKRNLKSNISIIDKKSYYANNCIKFLKN